MGTKTCRQHREQEATNCCKLKNTNVHFLDRQPSCSFLSHLLSLYSGFLPQRLRPFYERIRATCVLAPLYRHTILFILSLERNAIRICVLSTAGFTYQNSDRTWNRFVWRNRNNRKNIWIWWMIDMHIAIKSNWKSIFYWYFSWNLKLCDFNHVAFL